VNAGPTKRNIVEGVEHMGSFYRAMPAIANFIEADYNENELAKAYQDFCNIEPPDEPLPDDHDGYGVWWTNWTLKGKKLNFTICFEKYEGYFGWAIRCPDEETYLKTKEFISAHLRTG
jgi:hypothetical protein